MPAPTARQMQTRREAEEVADDILDLLEQRQAQRNERAGVVGDRVSVDNLVGPLYFFGGPFCDSGSGASALSDTSGGQGGGTGRCANSGVIVGVTVLAQVAPTTTATTVTVYINGATLCTVALDLGVTAISFLAADLSLPLSALASGDVMLVDFTNTDGTVAGVHVTVVLRCDVQRGLG